MSTFDTDLDDLYNEPEFRIEDQDIRLLKALLSDEQAARELSSTYDTNLFIGDAKEFAAIAIDYFKSCGQIPTKRIILDIAKDKSKTELFEIIWGKLDNIEYKSAEFYYDLDKIKNRFAKNQILALKEKLNNLDLDNVELDSVLNKTKSEIDYTEKTLKGENRVYTQKTLKEYMPEFRDDFVKKSKDPTLGQGILTGYSYLDYITNGLQPSEMLIIAAESGAGKSMFLNNMAIQMWMQNNTIENLKDFSKGYNILYFSLEMPYDQCARRTMSRLAQVSTYSLRNCQITDPSQLERIAKAANFIKKYPFEFEIVDIPRGVTVSQIEDRYKEAIARGRKPDVVVTDYLGLMEGEEYIEEDWLKLGKIAGELHEFGRLYNIVNLSAVQLNRPKGKDPSDIIGLHRIGRSSQIMHHASISLQIETRVDEITYSDLKYHIIKNRNGEMGYHSIQKKFSTATLIDDVKYVPQADDGIGSFSSPNFIEDISDKLLSFGW